MEKDNNTKLKKTASYECGICSNKFTESRSVFRHLKTVHGCQTYTKCKHCTQIYRDTSSCARHEKDAHGTHTEVSKNAVWSYKRNTLLESFFSRSGYKRTTKLMCSALLRSISGTLNYS